MPAACAAGNRAKYNPRPPEMSGYETATFACGCFWSKEYHFSRQPGVRHTRAGYTGGWKENPSYQEVCHKTTGHAEAVEVTFDPAAVSFENLLQFFFQLHDAARDRMENGGQYRSAIFYHTPFQQRQAEICIANLRAAGRAVVTQLEPAGIFWEAEERHQGWCERTGILPVLRAC